MVTTTAHFADSRYRTAPGDAYDGVVRVSYGGYYATGALLYDGRAILTTAHLFAGRVGTVEVSFETLAGMQTMPSAKMITHPGYDTQGNNDLAIVWLSGVAPIAAARYGIYRDSNEVGQIFTMVGYGDTGSGSTGAVSGDSPSPIRLKAFNQFDADAALLKTYFGSGMAWTPWAGTQLIADFDNGSAQHDALGRLIYRNDLGLGLNEGFVAPGDSGGPAFINGQVAGVASYTASLSRSGISPDIDASTNSSFGEIAAWQRVSSYQQWIDQSLRADFSEAPTRPEDVKKELLEGEASHAYFLLRFTGERSDPNQALSVNYSTRDGTARAGSDYIASSGTLKLYAGENQAVIPVEIIADNEPEPSETFFLDVFDAVGGSLGEGVVRLTAARTILDDDGWFA